MALNIAKILNCSRRFRGEIGLVIDSQGGDPMAVNQRVAGSSPADGANNYKAFKDEGQPTSPFFGNIIGKTTTEGHPAVPYLWSWRWGPPPSG